MAGLQAVHPHLIGTGMTMVADLGAEEAVVLAAVVVDCLAY
jgi:hypothetical protein